MMNSIINYMLESVEKNFITHFDEYLVSLGCDFTHRSSLKSKVLAHIKAPPGNIVISGAFITKIILDKQRQFIEIPFFIITSLMDASSCKIILSGKIGEIAGSRGVKKILSEIVEKAFNMKVDI